LAGLGGARRGAARSDGGAPNGARRQRLQRPNGEAAEPARQNVQIILRKGMETQHFYMYILGAFLFPMILEGLGPTLLTNLS